MGRIAEQEIERLKSEVSVEELARARGVELKRHGNDLIGLCPFHDDHEPSLVISPEKNLWHCLGACQAGGSVIDWVMRAEGVSFRHAVELLRAELPALAASSSSGPVKRSTILRPGSGDLCRLPLPTSPEAEDRELLGQVITYYHETLKQSPEALSYLERRGLRSSEMIERFRLGYANRTLGYRLPARNRSDGQKIRGSLQQLGILRESGHEHFNGSLVIPIFDEHGHVVEVYGRKIRHDLRPGTPLHLYLPGPHRGVWNLEALHASQEIILCEALIDALTFWCAGYRNVTSAYGIEGFTAEMLSAFNRFGIQRVLIAYDHDEAGERAAKLLADRLLAKWIACSRILFPRGMDANEHALKLPPAQKSPGSSPGQALGQLIRHAIWLGKGTCPELVERGEMEQATKEEEALAQVGPGMEPVTASPMDRAAKGEKDSSEDEEVAKPEPIASLPEPLSPLVAGADLPAAPPLPPASSEEIPVEVKSLPRTGSEGKEIVIRLGDRHWRIRGLSRNLSFDQLKVNLLAAREEGFFVDSLDLYSARARAAFIKQAAGELGLKEDLVKKDLGKVLLKLEELQEEKIARTLEPKEKPWSSPKRRGPRPAGS